MSGPIWLDTWTMDLEAALCPHCDRRYLYAPGVGPPRCPLCCQQELVVLSVEGELLPYTHPPELLLPFTVSEARFAEQVTAFARDIPFAPVDLTPENLRRRAQRIYLPRWLVDADVEAVFQTEVGFDYQVVSHRERYGGGQWQTEKVREDRVRWEPRIGRLRRHYPNVVVPALEEEGTWERHLGSYSEVDASTYEPEALAEATVTLPDRSPTDAWPDAVPTLRQRAQDETRRAAQAHHIRDFRWSPTFAEQHWTQLLRPVYATFYVDDEHQVHPVFLNGQTGQISGSRRASQARARRLALVLGTAAALVAAVSLVLGLLGLFAETALLTFAVGALALAIFLLLAALIPVAIVWSFNRRQT